MMTDGHLQTAGEKRENMRQTLETIQLQSSSILHLALQWKDLEEHFDAIMTEIGKREEEIELKMMQIEWKMKYMNKKLSDTEEKKIELKEMLELTEEKRKKVEELYETVRRKEECYDDDFESLMCKFERFSEFKREFRRKIKKRELRLEGRELLIDNKEHEVEFRVKKLNLIERDLMVRLGKIEEREKLIELKEKEKEKEKEKGFCNDNNSNIDKMKLKNEESDYNYADIRFNVVMNGKDLLKFLNGRVNDHEKLRDEVTRGISLSNDPPKLVLDAIEGFYPEDSRNVCVGFELDVVRKSCVLLLEQLDELKAEIKVRVRERAIGVAIDWRKKMNVGGGDDDDGCCLEVVGFLQLVASYGLVCVFDKEELLRFFESCARYYRAPELCCSLGFGDHVHDIIQNLILQGQPFEAIRLVYAFHLVDVFPPMPILTAHLKSTFHNAQKLYANGDASMEMQIKCINMKLAVLDSVVKCIKEYQIDSKYSVRNLEHQILKLQIQKRKCNASTCDSKAKITIKNEELCISLKHSPSSDKETDSSTCVIPDIPLLSAMGNEPYTSGKSPSSSLTESPYLDYTSGKSPSLDAQTQSNRGRKRPCLSSIVVADDEEQSLPSTYPHYGSYQSPYGSYERCVAYYLTPYQPYLLPI